MSINLEWLIGHIAELIMVVLPGYVFLACFQFCVTSRHGNIKPVSVECVIASYMLGLLYTGIQTVIITFCDGACASEQLTFNFLRRQDQNKLLNTVMLLLFSAIIGVLLGRTLAKQTIKEFIEKHFTVSLFSNPWLEIPNGREGDYVDVHLKDEGVCYRGWFHTHFLYNNETWVVIGDYIQIDPHTKVELKDAGCNLGAKQGFKQSPQILVNLQDITRIEFLGIPREKVSGKEMLDENSE